MFKVLTENSKMEDVLVLKEQIAAQQDMLARTTSYMTEIQKELLLKNSILEQKNHDIKQNLDYAGIIQNTLIPQREYIIKYLKDCFILHKQRDQIGGDLPWFRHQNKLSYIAAVDCTGHGIPGGMLTMVLYSLLNAVCGENGNALAQPGEILNRLNNEFKKYFGQNTNNANTRDGCDIALCIIDKEKNEIRFSGANRPMVVVTNNEAELFYAEKQSIGSAEIESFKTVSVPINPRSNYYIFTDGYFDQFGGPDDKRFKKKNLLGLLTSLQNLSMSAQNKILLETFINWKHTNEQTDDVLVIGFRP
jgi:serine phosphatase RsbU (regulator of sigma subunit)